MLSRSLTDFFTKKKPVVSQFEFMQAVPRPSKEEWHAFAQDKNIENKEAVPSKAVDE